MQERKRPMPVGIEDFKELVQGEGIEGASGGHSLSFFLKQDVLSGGGICAIIMVYNRITRQKMSPTSASGGVTSQNRR